MDYKEVRKRNKIKKNGGSTEGRGIKQPKRVDYTLRRKVIWLCTLAVMAIVLGAGLILIKM